MSNFDPTYDTTSCPLCGFPLQYFPDGEYCQECGYSNAYTNHEEECEG